MQGSPENQVPAALGDHDINTMQDNLAPLVIPQAKALDSRFHSPTDSSMSPASQFVNNKKKGSKLRPGAFERGVAPLTTRMVRMDETLPDGNFTQAAKPAASSRFAPTSRFAPAPQ